MIKVLLTNWCECCVRYGEYRL